MTSSPNATRPVDWAKRINSSWIVHQGLREQAAGWIAHLEATDPHRLHDSCLVAQEMCEHRGCDDDPKPWFYSGLFSMATADEARRFLASHKLTSASVPALADDEGVRNWTASLCAETTRLLGRLRAALRTCLD